MKEKLAALKIEYRTNPGWCWLLAILFLFPLLPEYVSPFILFAGFIVFKVQWSREGRKAKVGTIGKMMMLFMGYALLSTLWSPTSFSTFSTAALWWGMFLLQVMIYNLARSRDKIDALLQTCTASACVNGVIGTLQICGYTLNRYDCIPDGAVLVTPLYKGLDKFVYTHLPFAISTKTFDSRASGTFSHPNLFHPNPRRLRDCFGRLGLYVHCTVSPVLEADAHHLPAHHCSDRALHSRPVRHYLLLRGQRRGQKVLCGAL